MSIRAARGAVGVSHVLPVSSLIEGMGKLPWSVAVVGSVEA